MKTLVDSSVWISHFKTPNLRLISLLENTYVVTHSFILTELYLGIPKNKKEIFSRLNHIPVLRSISYAELCFFIDEFNLAGKGLGLVDTSILASAYLNDVSLYTLDKKLAAAARRIGIS